MHFVARRLGAEVTQSRTSLQLGSRGYQCCGCSELKFPQWKLRLVPKPVSAGSTAQEPRVVAAFADRLAVAKPPGWEVYDQGDIKGFLSELAWYGLLGQFVKTRWMSARFGCRSSAHPAICPMRQR